MRVLIRASLESRIGLETLAKSERFTKDLDKLKGQGYEQIQVAKGLSQVDMAIAAGKQALQRPASPSISHVFYCSYWGDENWGEFHCLKIHHQLGLAPDIVVTNVKSNNSTAIFSAFSLARLILQEKPDKAVLVLSADKVDKRFVRRRFSAGVFGDGAAAVFLTTRELTDTPSMLFETTSFSQTDSRFFALYAYETNQAKIDDAFSDLKSVFFSQANQKISDAPYRIISQLGRWYESSGSTSAQQFVGLGAKRGFLPASGLLHVIHDFLLENNSDENLLLIEPGIGIQFAGLFCRRRTLGCKNDDTLL